MTFSESVVRGRDTPQDAPRRTIETEVVVVGTGAGGGPFAAELAEAGVDVVLLEEGGYYRTEDFTTSPNQMVKMLYRNAGSTVVFGKPNVFWAEGRCVGGSTVINAGISWRTPERILKRWRWEHGIDGLESERMDEYFSRVEQRVHVAPQDPRTVGGDSHVLKEGADALGYRAMPVRRNQKFCVGTNNCIFGCPTGAKQSVLLTYIPRALAAGARLFADCRAERVVHTNGRASGVIASFLDPQGAPRGELEVRAKHVVLACGATQTPVLLQKSKVRDPHKQLGRHMLLHPNAKVLGMFDEELDAWKGAIQNWQITEFLEEGLLFGTTFVPPSVIAMTLPESGAAADAMMQKYNQMVSAAVLVEDTDSVGRVRRGFRGEAHMTYRLGDLDFERMQRGVAILSEIYFAAGAKQVVVPYHGRKPLTSPDEIAGLFADPPKRTEVEVLTVHAMGTARMGGDPKRSMTDSYGRLRGLDNVWVSDASLLPSSVGVNPQITIMGLATRNAQHFLEARSGARPEESSNVALG